MLCSMSQTPHPSEASHLRSIRSLWTGTSCRSACWCTSSLMRPTTSRCRPWSSPAVTGASSTSSQLPQSAGSHGPPLHRCIQSQRAETRLHGAGCGWSLVCMWVAPSRTPATGSSRTAPRTAAWSTASTRSPGFRKTGDLATRRCCCFNQTSHQLQGARVKSNMHHLHGVDSVGPELSTTAEQSRCVCN